jgi:hypothetical protein
MPKAYDRVKNANSGSENFLKTPYWTPQVEMSYVEWLKDRPRRTLEEVVDSYLQAGVAVSFKELSGSVCCTLAHQESRDNGLPYLLTGWSEAAMDALGVAEYKLLGQLDGIWAELPPLPASKRH